MAQTTKQLNIYRRKLLNSVLFFARNVHYPNTTVISKLLYFLDFNHVEQTGYPSIGLEYHAFSQGPVPKDFWLEIKDGNVPDDFKGSLSLNTKTDESNPEYKEIEFIANQEPDLGIFTPREQKILKELVDIFKDETAKEMSRISHKEGQPWALTTKVNKGIQPIDYILAINENSSITKEEASEHLNEHFEVVNNFSLSPTKK